MNTYYITFYSHYSAISFSKEIGRYYENVTVTLMPVPRALSSSCGTCARLIMEQLLTKPDMDGIEGVYLLKDGKYEPI